MSGLGVAVCFAAEMIAEDELRERSEAGFRTLIAF